MTDAEASAAGPDPHRYLQHAQQLVDALQQGRADEASRLLDELTALREREIYRQIVELTRRLRESFSAFLDNTAFVTIARDEIPDARERLEHVIALTHDSAERTLSAVETCLPLARAIGERAQTFADRRSASPGCHADAGERRAIDAELAQLLADTRADAKRLHAGLCEILVAQEFQDLAGQLIQRVIALVNEVETQLISIIALAGQGGDDRRRADPDGLGGPVVPALAAGNVVSDQDEVDALLSGLGR